MKSLEQQLAKWQKSAARAKAAAAGLIEKQIKKHQSEIDRLSEMASSFGGAISASFRSAKKTTKKATKEARKKSKKRVRRSREDIEKLATEAVAVIKSKGKEGAAAGDLKQFGIIGSPIQWFREYAPKGGVKRRGEKSKTRYFIG